MRRYRPISRRTVVKSGVRAWRQCARDACHSSRGRGRRTPTGSSSSRRSRIRPHRPSTIGSTPISRARRASPWTMEYPGFTNIAQTGRHPHTPQAHPRNSSGTALAVPWRWPFRGNWSPWTTWCRILGIPDDLRLIVRRPRSIRPDQSAVRLWLVPVRPIRGGRSGPPLPTGTATWPWWAAQRSADHLRQCHSLGRDREHRILLFETMLQKGGWPLVQLRRCIRGIPGSLSMKATT